jgi:1L-myo-inositol 1-phosphate cytidylyltransferase
MKCLVLAAGHGSRLREVSDSKPLTPVQGVPLIERVISGAAEAGARDFLVVTGHQAVRVEAFLAGLPARLGVAVDWVRADDWDRPNGYSVLAAADWIDSDHLLLMSDHLFDPDILRRLLAMSRDRIGLRLAVDRELVGAHVDLDDATKVERGGDGAIVRIGKALHDYDSIDTGLFIATPSLAASIRDDIAAGGGGSLSEGVQRLADRGMAQTMEIGSARWIDVDDRSCLVLAEGMVVRGELRGSAA